MAKYRITRQEVYLQDVEVDADNVNEAIELVLEGDGVEVGEPRFHSTYDDIEPCDVVNLDTGKTGEEELEEV